MMGLVGEGVDLYRGTINFYRWLQDEIVQWVVGEGAWMKADRGMCTATAGRTHNAEKPHRSVDKQGKPLPGYMCETHFVKLGKMLRDIETEAGDLDISPSMALSFEHGGGGLASQQTPVRLDPLVLNDWRHSRGDSEGEEETRASGNTVSLMNTLCRYSWKVRAQRSISIPVIEWVERMPGQADRGPVCPRPCGHDTCQGMAWWRSRPHFTVHSERDVLTRQLEWISNQDWAGTFFDAMAQLLNQLQRANGTATPKPIPGQCPALVGDKECGGPLWPTKPKATSESDKWKGSAPSAIRCGACNTRWEGGGPLARLAIILDQQQQANKRVVNTPAVQADISV